jgi:dTDP-4-dehydrorhamnose 3,5-epimerase
MARPSESPRAPSVRTIEPPEIRISGVVVLPRTLHQDPRGFLVETLRRDDSTVAGDAFEMSYTSVTVPGEMRDRDRWHFHHRQEDRFVVPLGEMILALFDRRPESPTRGRLEVIRMAGPGVARSHAPGGKRDLLLHLVTVPREVLHAIGNLHPSDPFVLQNYPTRLYDATDEGRVPFADVPVDALGSAPFGWDRVEVRRP